MTAPVPAGSSRSPASDASRAARLGASARGGVDKVLPVLKKLVPIARRLGTVVRAYAGVAGAAVVIIAIALVLSGPVGWGQWVAVTVLVAILAVPVVMLWIFATALDEAVALPDRIRENPELLQGHAVEVADLVRESHARSRQRRWLVGLPGDLWKAGRLLLGAHRDLPEYGHAIRLISVPYLFATALAAVAALMEVLMAPVVVLLAVVLA
ncbi:MAG: hypothetical protein R2726_04170 [Acidimicrobiales bacterium]